jgi:site-specific DNA-methyltransferase (adenine-specific)
MADGDFHRFLVDAFSAARDILKPGGVFYIWHADSEGLNFRSACSASDLQIRQCLIWNKNSIVIGRQDYHWKHEPCLYGWKSGAAHTWMADRKQSTILDFDRPSRSTEHPTMKPVDLFANLVVNSTTDREIVYDPFLGSGTTLIACEKLGRICYGLEIDPVYCDVIIARYRSWCESNSLVAQIKTNGIVQEYAR